MTKCLPCNRIKMIKSDSNPYFVKELDSGYVVLADSQFYVGYAIFLSKIHVQELHELPTELKMQFLLEMSIVGEAVFKAFKPAKLNYELLG